jgi:hypothetical protein
MRGLCDLCVIEALELVLSASSGCGLSTFKSHSLPGSEGKSALTSFFQFSSTFHKIGHSFFLHHGLEIFCVCMYLCQCDNCDLLIFSVLKHISNKGSWDLTWYVMYAQTRLHTIFSFQTLLAYTWSLTSTCNLSYHFQTSFYMRNFAHPCQILLDSKFLQLHGICKRWPSFLCEYQHCYCCSFWHNAFAWKWL